MELFTEKSQCCGCTACYNICPKSAIKMQLDHRGFRYPEIDNSLCINCGACQRVCSIHSGYEKNSLVKCYALKHKNPDTHKTSQSGGAFAGLAEYIFQLDGVVYGAAYNSDFSVSHLRCDSAKDLRKLQGVKYVQSELSDTFAQVKKDLKDGKYVLFSGTGCQVGGLTSFLKGTDATKLFTADLICHGAPANKFWQEYLRWCEKKYKGKVTNAVFRDPTYGWHGYFESVYIDKKKYKLKKFISAFEDNLIFRPSCYKCRFTNMNRPGDFTLGDFWGIKKQLPDFYDPVNGCSIFLINSSKGQDLFNKLSDKFELRDADVEKAAISNPNLCRPTKMPENYQSFWATYEKKGYDFVVKCYYKKLIKRKIKGGFGKIKRIFVKQKD